MQRRKAVIAAATASLTLLAGAAAIGLNTGIVGASGDDGVGQISPVDPATTGVADDPAAGLTTAPSATRSDDDFDEFENNDRGDDHGDDHDDDREDHEYEGADDDD